MNNPRSHSRNYRMQIVILARSNLYAHWSLRSTGLSHQVSNSEIAPGPPVTGTGNSVLVGEYLTGREARIHTTMSHYVLRNPTSSVLAEPEREYLKVMTCQSEGRPAWEISHDLWRLPQPDNDITAGSISQASTWVAATTTAIPRSSLCHPPPQGAVCGFWNLAYL